MSVLERVRFFDTCASACAQGHARGGRGVAVVRGRGGSVARGMDRAGSPSGAVRGMDRAGSPSGAVRGMDRAGSPSGAAGRGGAESPLRGHGLGRGVAVVRGRGASVGVKPGRAGSIVRERASAKAREKSCEQAGNSVPAAAAAAAVAAVETPGPSTAGSQEVSSTSGAVNRVRQVRRRNSQRLSARLQDRVGFFQNVGMLLVPKVDEHCAHGVRRVGFSESTRHSVSHSINSQLDSQIRKNRSLVDVIISDSSAPTHGTLDDKRVSSGLLQSKDLKFKLVPHEARVRQGGFGMVQFFDLRWSDPHTDRVVAVRQAALKIPFLVKFRDSPVRLDHLETVLRREERFYKKLRHPNVVHVFFSLERVHTFIEDDHEVVAYGMFMELADKDNLTTFVAQQMLSPHDRLGLAEDMMHGLVYLHQVGLIHNDLKPENVLIFSSESPKRYTAKLADLGTSFYCEDGYLSFNKSDFDENVSKNAQYSMYTAPERMVDGIPQRSSDIYSIGLVLYFLFSLQRPFGKVGHAPLVPSDYADLRDYGRLLREHVLTHSPDLSQVHSALRLNTASCEKIDNIIAPALSRDPSRRPTAVRLLSRLQNLRQVLSIDASAYPTEPVYDPPNTPPPSVGSIGTTTTGYVFSS